MTDPKRIVSILRDECDKNATILGLVLVGSQARKDIYTAGEHSDFEVYIIVKDGETDNIEKQLPDLVNKLGKVIFSYKNRWAGFSSVFEDLFRLELPIAEISELSQVFSRPKAQTAKILIDKTDGLLKKSMKSRPETIDYERLYQEKVSDFWYMLVVAAQYYKKGEYYNTRSVLNILQSTLIKLFELLNDPKILLLESNKRIEEFLSKDQLKLLQHVSPSYEREQIYQGLLNIIDIVPVLFREVAEKYNYSLDTLESEIKPKVLKLLKD